MKVYDRLFRLWHALDRPAATVGPVLRVEIQRSRRTCRFADGATLHRGDAVCVIHLNNDRVQALHSKCDSPVRVGLEFRRQLVTSLRVLARLAAAGGRLERVQALAATTVFHQGLKRLGFEAGPDPLRWPKLVSIYQRALLASLHPAGRLRLRRMTYQRAERVWMSRNKLMALYGDGIAQVSRSAAPVRRREPRELTVAAAHPLLRHR